MNDKVLIHISSIMAIDLVHVTLKISVCVTSAIGIV